MTDYSQTLRNNGMLLLASADALFAFHRKSPFSQGYYSELHRDQLRSIQKVKNTDTLLADSFSNPAFKTAYDVTLAACHFTPMQEAIIAERFYKPATTPYDIYTDLIGIVLTPVRMNLDPEYNDGKTPSILEWGQDKVQNTCQTMMSQNDIPNEAGYTKLVTSYFALAFQEYLVDKNIIHVSAKDKEAALATLARQKELVKSCATLAYAYYPELNREAGNALLPNIVAPEFKSNTPS